MYDVSVSNGDLFIALLDSQRLLSPIYTRESISRAEGAAKQCWLDRDLGHKTKLCYKVSLLMGYTTVYAHLLEGQYNGEHDDSPT